MQEATEVLNLDVVVHGKKVGIYTKRSDKALTNEEIDEAIAGSMYAAGQYEANVSPSMTAAVNNVKSAMVATEVKPDRPAPPAPVPQTASGEMRIEATNYNDKFLIYDHPQAILTPDGKKAILLWAKGKNGKAYAKWVGEDVASGQVKQMDGWGVLCTYDIDKAGLPAL
jgi:hypothetical protein